MEFFVVVELVERRYGACFSRAWREKEKYSWGDLNVLRIP
jgi:hypothetical protein